MNFGFGKWLALCVLAGSIGCARERGGSHPHTEPLGLTTDNFRGINAFQELREFVEIGPRVSGTEGAQKAAMYLANRLRTHGWDAQIDEFADFTPAGELTFRNVVAKKTGINPKIVILGSHYDTKADLPPAFQGANDSGSSTAVLLEIARVLGAYTNLPLTLWLAFFDGEECRVRYSPHDGLHGSRRLAKQVAREGTAQDIIAVVILDMVGDCDLQITIPRNSTPALAGRAFEAARLEGQRALFTFYPGEILDDHVPFLELGIPSIDIIDFYFGSAPQLNDYWHTARDRIESVCPESLETVGRVTLRLLLGLFEKPESR